MTNAPKSLLRQATSLTTSYIWIKTIRRTWRSSHWRSYWLGGFQITLGWAWNQWSFGNLFVIQQVQLDKWRFYTKNNEVANHWRFRNKWQISIIDVVSQLGVKLKYLCLFHPACWMRSGGKLQAFHLSTLFMRSSKVCVVCQRSTTAKLHTS